MSTIQPSCRIRPDDTRVPVDTPYEQGFYFGSIGAEPGENPYPRLEKNGAPLVVAWLRGWQDATKATAEYHRNKR